MGYIISTALSGSCCMDLTSLSLILYIIILLNDNVTNQESGMCKILVSFHLKLGHIHPSALSQHPFQASKHLNIKGAKKSNTS